MHIPYSCDWSIHRKSTDHWDDQVQSLGSDLKGISIQELVPKTENLPPDLSVDSSIGSFPVAMDTGKMMGREYESRLYCESVFPFDVLILQTRFQSIATHFQSEREKEREKERER